MIILGVDPGSLITGYGIISSQSGRPRMLACDAIKNDGSRSMPERLQHIFDRLREVIIRYRPDAVAIETAFYGKNAQSALKLGHARGAAMLAAVTGGLQVLEYSPREVKKAVAGNGNASKQQVQYMVKSLLRLRETPKYYDTTDALAVAICHLQRGFVRQSSIRTWKAFLAAHPDREVPAGKVAR